MKISIDISLVIQIVGFLVLIWAMNRVMYKPIRGILAERKTKIQGMEVAISGADAEVDKKEKEYADGIRQARIRGQKEKESLMEAAMAEEKALIEKINTAAQAELKVVKTRITEEMNAVKAALEAEIDAFANAIEQKILGRVA
ncbi:ATP synthase F0 subunit B [Desulfosarcina sp. OttesenSCG-928-A07]|nr:ATP synthase F0 subunit B [Desulfosarcina sp. OttesenSCG-928-G17]MDL2329416.1 ATP synthase F0 subunit B [Desulfosarcina sp. OttesenSCG-928-A07]